MAVHLRTASGNLEGRLRVESYREMLRQKQTDNSYDPTAPHLILFLDDDNRRPNYLYYLELLLEFEASKQLYDELKEGKPATVEYKIKHSKADGLARLGLFVPLISRPAADDVNGRVVVEGGQTYPFRLRFKEDYLLPVLESISMSSTAT